MLLNKFAESVKSLEVVPPTISFNQPLKENLLAIWACLLTKIPLIICGKPGTSKTLSTSIIYEAANLTSEKKAQSEFFQILP